MSVEARPLGVNCNIACRYCYQHPQRRAGQLTRSYDLEAMKRALEAEGRDFILFGGEPLMLPVEDLEELWAWGLERFGTNGIQTNGTLIADHHIDLFRRYEVEVGLSLDGPGELNDARWAGTAKRTRRLTRDVEGAIEKLLAAGIVPSLIVTLHRGNATSDKLPRMHEWFRTLDTMGIESVRLHTLEVDDAYTGAHLALTADENVGALMSFARLQDELERLRIDVFADLENMLLAMDHRASCVWRACDPYTTEAVRGVEGRGQRSNCGRTNKDGIDYVKSDAPGYERYWALYHTPQEHGGCQGCRFFLACKGQCPGTAIDGDWRNRTSDCETWKALFEFVETKLVERGAQPISQSPNLRYLEEHMLAAWARGGNPSLREKIDEMWAMAREREGEEVPA